MKISIITIALLLSIPLAQAGEIKKWVDKNGKVHYGDNKAVVEDAVTIEKLETDNSFDPDEYQEAIKRNEEIEKDLEAYERERKQQERKEKMESALDRLSKPTAPPAGGTTITTPPPAVYTGPGRPTTLPAGSRPRR